MENKKFALKKKTISLDLTNEDTIKSKRKKNMEIVKSELKKLDVIQDESPTEAKNPQLVTLGMFFLFVLCNSFPVPKIALCEDPVY